MYMKYYFKLGIYISASAANCYSMIAGFIIAESVTFCFM